MTKTRKKVAFLAGPRSFGGPTGPRVLAEAPLDVEATIVDATLPDDEKVRLLQDVEAIVVISEPLDFSFLRGCPSVKLVQSISAGNDLLDLKSLAELGIPLASNGGSNATAVAEYAIALMIAASRKMMSHWHNVVNERRWKEGLEGPPGIEITGKTVGIVGFGAIGKNVARLLRGFDTETIYYDVVEVPLDIRTELMAEPASLEDVMRRSDIVSLHLPYYSKTRKIIGEHELALMKPTSYLINTGRGGIVDEEALYRVLKNKSIAGAALDVFDPEPPSPDNPLFDLDNVVATPHRAGGTQESSVRGVRFCWANIGRVLLGEPPLAVVGPEG